MKIDNNNPEISLYYSTREALIKANSEIIKSLLYRVSQKRFRAQEADNIKLGYIRCLIQAVQAQNQILKDSELDELKEEIEDLRELIQNHAFN